MKNRSKVLSAVIIPNNMTLDEVSNVVNLLKKNDIDDIMVLDNMSFCDALRSIKPKRNFIVIDKLISDFSLNENILNKNCLMKSFLDNKFDLQSLSFSLKSFNDFKNQYEKDSLGFHLCSKDLCDIVSWNYDWHSVPDVLCGIATSDLIKTICRSLYI